jgi:hypothetical protein
VIHFLNTLDGQLRIDDPEYVRIDRAGEHEFYVMIIDAILEQTAYSLHEDAAEAEHTAASLAKRLGCDWGKNYDNTDDRSEN